MVEPFHTRPMWCAVEHGQAVFVLWWLRSKCWLIKTRYFQRVHNESKTTTTTTTEMLENKTRLMWSISRREASNRNPIGRWDRPVETSQTKPKPAIWFFLDEKKRWKKNKNMTKFCEMDSKRIISLILGGSIVLIDRRWTMNQAQGEDLIIYVSRAYRIGIELNAISGDFCVV